MRLEAFDNVFQNSVEGIDANFTVTSLWGNTGGLKEGKQVRPGTLTHLDARDGSDHPSGRVADKFFCKFALVRTWIVAYTWMYEGSFRMISASLDII